LGIGTSFQAALRASQLRCPLHARQSQRSIAWLVANGNRRVRYHGIERNQHGLTTRVAAINLRRLVNLGLHPTETGWALA
jgi:hypothetical protein